MNKLDLKAKLKSKNAQLETQTLLLDEYRKTINRQDIIIEKQRMQIILQKSKQVKE